jgi:hypothetical protein
MTAPTFVFKLELRGTSRLKRNVLNGCSALSDGKTMRIAQIAPLAESVPPKVYGGNQAAKPYSSARARWPMHPPMLLEWIGYAAA